MNPRQRIAQLESLIDELLSGIQDVLRSGEVLSDEFQGLLAREIDATLNEIEQLQSQVTEEAPTAPQVTPSNDAQLLWILAGQQEQAFISYLRNYPTPATQSLLSNPLALSQTIDQLNQMMPAGQPPFINGIPHADLQSSNVWGASYDPRSAKLKVRFQGGSEYEYDGVPENIFKAFIKGNASARTKGKNRYGEWWVGKNPSLGAALNQYIKAGGFPYRKLR